MATKPLAANSSPGLMTLSGTMIQCESDLSEPPFFGTRFGEIVHRGGSHCVDSTHVGYGKSLETY